MRWRVALRWHFFYYSTLGSDGTPSLLFSTDLSVCCMWSREADKAGEHHCKHWNSNSLGSPEWCIEEGPTTQHGYPKSWSYTGYGDTGLRRQWWEEGQKRYLYMTISTIFQLLFSIITQKDTQIAIKIHCKCFIFICTSSFHEHL